MLRRAAGVYEKIVKRFTAQTTGGCSARASQRRGVAPQACVGLGLGLKPGTYTRHAAHLWGTLVGLERSA